MNWDLFCQARGTANRLYEAAKARYSADCRRNLDDCASANAWWRTLKGHEFGAESDIPLLCSLGSALVSDPAGKAELFSAWFDSKQSRDIVELRRPVIIGLHSVVLPSELVRLRGTCWILIQMVVWTRLVASLCFFQRTASVLAPKLSRLFRRLLRCDEFPLEWRFADVTPIPKGPLSTFVCNYRPI